MVSRSLVETKVQKPSASNLFAESVREAREPQQTLFQRWASLEGGIFKAEDKK
jgi:hypothetical protein